MAKLANTPIFRGLNFFDGGSVQPEGLGFIKSYVLWGAIDPEKAAKVAETHQPPVSVTSVSPGEIRLDGQTVAKLTALRLSLKIDDAQRLGSPEAADTHLETVAAAIGAIAQRPEPSKFLVHLDFDLGVVGAIPVPGFKPYPAEAA